MVIGDRAVCGAFVPGGKAFAAYTGYPAVISADFSGTSGVGGSPGLLYGHVKLCTREKAFRDRKPMGL